jgi:endogenous inhibitor of DNA gyrase (YacG/DUF329 family)
MNDTAKALTIPGIALAVLTGGTVGFGYWCGLTVGQSLAVFGVVLLAVVVIATPQVVYDRMKERKFRATLLKRSCPKCERPYELADLSHIGILMSTGSPLRGRCITCPDCGTETPWTEAGELWWSVEARRRGKRPGR